MWCWRRLLRVPWTARRSNQSSKRRSVLGAHWKDWCWSWNSNTLATWCKELTHWKRPWCWERLGAGGKGDDRGWDGWMASPTRWTWVWVNSGSWWWTGRPGVLWFIGLQRLGHDWAAELNKPSKKQASLSIKRRRVWNKIHQNITGVEIRGNNLPLFSLKLSLISKCNFRRLECWLCHWPPFLPHQLLKWHAETYRRVTTSSQNNVKLGSLKVGMGGLCHQQLPV